MTYKKIRKTWVQYMIDQYNEKHAERHGAFEKAKPSIRENGDVIVLGKFGKEVLEEVGMDYRTFRLKFDTSENPMGL